MKSVAVLLAGMIVGWALHGLWLDLQPSPAGVEIGANPAPETGIPETRLLASPPAQRLPGEPGLAESGTAPAGPRPGTTATEALAALVATCGGVDGKPRAPTCSDSVIALAGERGVADPLFRETLESWLIEYPADTRSAMALIDDALSRNDFNHVADILSRLQGHAAAFGAGADAPDMARTVVGRALASRPLENDPGARAGWLETLVDLYPGEKAWRYELASALAELGDYQRAMDMIHYLLYDPAFGQRADTLRAAVLERLELSTHDAIPLQRVGRHFLVEATVNRHTPLQLLIDTGASITALSAAALARIGAGPSIGEIRLDTANGVTSAHLFQLDSLSVGRRRMAGIQVVALDQGFSAADGLLGMNYLSRFHFIIDQHENLLYLDPQ